MFLQTYILNEMEVGTQDVVRSLVVKYTDKQAPDFGNASPKILFQVKKRLDDVVLRCQEECLGLSLAVVGHAHRDRWYGLSDI